MMINSPHKQPITLLKLAINTIINHPIILYPFTIIFFIQIIILEVLLFATRNPLSLFFGPLIRRLEGEIYLHYPFNYVVLTKWFQGLEVWIYLFINSFFIGVAIAIIDLINKEKPINFKAVYKHVLSLYIHLLIGAFLTIMALIIFSVLNDLLIKRALIIRSTSGIFYIIKRIVLDGAPYFNLLFAIVVTTLFAYLIPIIILEKKKIFSAVILNFKNLFRSFWFIFVLVFLPGLLYVPVLVLKTRGHLLEAIFIPEVWGFLIILSVIVKLLIDAIQYTAITTYYLANKDL